MHRPRNWQAPRRRTLSRGRGGCYRRGRCVDRGGGGHHAAPLAGIGRWIGYTGTTDGLKASPGRPLADRQAVSPARTFKRSVTAHGLREVPACSPRRGVASVGAPSVSSSSGTMRSMGVRSATNTSLSRIFSKMVSATGGLPAATAAPRAGPSCFWLSTSR